MEEVRALPAPQIPLARTERFYAFLASPRQEAPVLFVVQELLRTPPEIRHAQTVPRIPRARSVTLRNHLVLSLIIHQRLVSANGQRDQQANDHGDQLDHGQE